MPIPPEEQVTVPMTVPLTPALAERIKQAAEADERRPATWARRALVKALDADG